MIFLNRKEELERLDGLTQGPNAGLAVLYGRRRVGKTRLLLQWVKKRKGAYWVADQSAEQLQRRYFAASLSRVLPDFDAVEYPDWQSLLTRLTREVRRVGWRGPLVIDELPYLVAACPTLPSVLQRWIDHEAKEAGLIVALAGSSQRMMQGLVLDRAAPLFGRAQEVFEVFPLAPEFLSSAFPTAGVARLVEAFAAWGGVPRYWELAQAVEEESISDQIDRLVLDPLGPLHQEPDRLLLEETPPAIELRPILDVIGAGVHRVSEIAGRIGKPATSMARPLERLRSLSLIHREIPFAESEKKSRRALYRIADPFLRLWFRVVAPHRSDLASLPRRSRGTILQNYWGGLLSEAWEQLCRHQLPRRVIPSLGDEAWGSAGRWWHGNLPEWDVVAGALTGKRLLLGEAKWSKRPFDKKSLLKLARELKDRPTPQLPRPWRNPEIIRALFVPDIKGNLSSIEAVKIVRGADLGITRKK